jgi:hypothetical protein
MISAGFVFFNFGGRCIARLLVALYTLRKFYSGRVVVFLAKGDPFCEAAEADIAEYADVVWFDLEKLATRNLKCVIKPALFEMSPFDHTIMLDGDLLFQANPWELMDPLVEKGFLVTKFSTWHTDGRKMAARMNKFDKNPLVTPEQIEVFRGVMPNPKVAAINIGVMGWSKRCPEVMARWKELTLSIAGVHMADEHAAQITYPFYPTALMGPEWNESCVFPSRPGFAHAKVLHYHGGKHSAPERASSRLWLQALQRLWEDSPSWVQDRLKTYISQDPCAPQNTAKIPGFYTGTTFVP